MNKYFGHDPPPNPAPGTWTSYLLQRKFGPANAAHIDSQSNLSFRRDQSSFELFAQDSDGNYPAYTAALRLRGGYCSDDDESHNHASTILRLH
jgi:hypothetical protein